MRVIAGAAKGRPLKGPRAAKGAIRPTSDKVREALFDLLQDRISGSRVLDLYAGTGALAIEALSRGAAEAVLVEQEREALSIVRENLQRTALAGKARLIPARVERSFEQLAGHYDLILADPPYADPAIAGMMPRLAGLLEPDGVLAIEHSSRVALPDSVAGLCLWKRRRYGDTMLSLYRQSETGGQPV